jgi:hypothetical protein
MNRRLTQLSAFGCLFAPIFAWPAVFTVENETLAVKYDDAVRAFSNTGKVSRKVFAVVGKLESVDTKATVESSHDTGLGTGWEVVLAQAQAGGSIVSLALNKNLPFLLVGKLVKNTDADGLDMQKTIPASFMLDLGKPANERTTMSTGGLLSADKNPGSYFFLTVADPATQIKGQS